jgi:predicted RNA binding protein YcfA (HicA-like mRNA interferase family)
MPLTYKTISIILRDYNFQKVRQVGSHQQFYLWSDWLAVPEKKEFAIGTAQSMLKRIAEITNQDYKYPSEEVRYKVLKTIIYQFWNLNFEFWITPFSARFSYLSRLSPSSLFPSMQIIGWNHCNLRKSDYQKSIR